MLTGLDDVGWSDPGVVDWLRGLAGEGDELDDVPATILCDSALGNDAVAVTPLLLDLAVGAAGGRGDAVAVLAMMVSPEFETSGDSARVRAAVAARSAEVAALADDGNGLVRAHTCLIVGRCEGPADVLVRRWDVETDPDARAALLIALPARSPDAVARVVVPAVLDGSPADRASAAAGQHAPTPGRQRSSSRAPRPTPRRSSRTAASGQCGSPPAPTARDGL